MRVYFTASLRGKKQFGDNYRSIVKSLSELGVKVYSEHILESDYETVVKQDLGQSKQNYHYLLSEIKKSDIFVAEVSAQSLSVGHEITEAMNRNIPVVLFYTGDNRPGLLFGSKYEKLQIVEYEINNKLKVLCEKALAEASKRVDVRFNFFVSPKILAYLDWIAQKRMVPRSVFLRNLIDREMKKDKEFKQ
jgi:hypothetical protein